MLILPGCHDVSLGSRHSSQGLGVQVADCIGADILKADGERDVVPTNFLQNAERNIAGGAGVDCPLFRSDARPKVRLSCDGSDIRHAKAECGIDCGCARSLSACEASNFVKREAHSLSANSKGCNMCKTYNISPEIFNYCSSNCEINLQSI